jgi:hypothetical protein
MAPRANWKGFLRLSLITCPVALYPAISDFEKISFNQINRNTGHRIKYLKVDADTGEEVSSKDIVKGYKVDPTATANRTATENMNPAEGFAPRCLKKFLIEIPSRPADITAHDEALSLAWRPHLRRRRSDGRLRKHPQRDREHPCPIF